MQYFLGSLISIFIFYIISKAMVYKYVVLNKDKDSFFKIKYSQSHIHSIVSPLLPPSEILNAKINKKTQASVHIKKNRVKVLIIDGKAYWKKDNVLYVADVVNDEIERDLATVVDIMGMDKVELDKMLFIVDQLTEGDENDSGSTGKQ